jgi:hypothetical protein
MAWLDDRGLSETAGVAFTIVVTATVGLNVLVIEAENAGPEGANFSYTYIDANSALIVTHEEGNEYPAGSLLVNASGREMTWADLAGPTTNASMTVGPGDTIQLSSGSTFGTTITRSDRVRIFLAQDGNRTMIDEWTDR